MSLDTAITDRSSPVPQPKVRAQDSAAYQMLKTIASLRLTVVLFVLSLVLVFFGTWAQLDPGIWTVVNRSFRSFFVFIPLKVLVFHADWLKPYLEDSWERIGIPFPGGWLLGGIMLVNLLAAHFIHFKPTWRRSGVLMIHV